MHAPISTSNPFFVIARHHAVDYGMVLNLADWFKAGGSRGADSYWQFQARQHLRTLPAKQSLAIQDDVMETCRRLGHCE